MVREDGEGLPWSHIKGLSRRRKIGHGRWEDDRPDHRLPSGPSSLLDGEVGGRVNP